jgi:hypothetical protein
VRERERESVCVCVKLRIDTDVDAACTVMKLHMAAIAFSLGKGVRCKQGMCNSNANSHDLRCRTSVQAVDICEKRVSNCVKKGVDWTLEFICLGVLLRGEVQAGDSATYKAHEPAERCRQAFVSVLSYALLQHCFKFVDFLRLGR